MVASLIYHSRGYRRGSRYVTFRLGRFTRLGTNEDKNYRTLRTHSDKVGTDSRISADVDDAGGENGSVHGMHEFEVHAAADVLLLEHRAAPS